VTSRTGTQALVLEFLAVQAGNSRPAPTTGSLWPPILLPEGGLAFEAMHKVAAGSGAVHGAAAALFAAGIAARTGGHVLWCVTRRDLFAPALVLAGLAPDRVIYVEAGDEKAVFTCFEEALRHRKLGAVVAEVASLSMTASRRLQIAAEDSGLIGLALRRWRRQAAAADFGQPTASTTRWCVSALPSTPLPVPGVGRARWRLELVRCRGGEAQNSRSRLAMPGGVSLCLRSIRAVQARM
jgi:protein ImuA